MQYIFYFKRPRVLLQINRRYAKITKCLAAFRSQNNKLLRRWRFLYEYISFAAFREGFISANFGFSEFLSSKKEDFSNNKRTPPSIRESLKLYLQVWLLLCSKRHWEDSLWYLTSAQKINYNLLRFLNGCLYKSSHSTTSWQAELTKW